MTNRDKLNNMSNEELAELLSFNVPEVCIDCFWHDFCNNCTPYNSCKSVIFRWLESEINNDK